MSQHISIRDCYTKVITWEELATQLILLAYGNDIAMISDAEAFPKTDCEGSCFEAKSVKIHILTDIIHHCASIYFIPFHKETRCLHIVKCECSVVK